MGRLPVTVPYPQTADIARTSLLLADTAANKCVRACNSDWL